MYINSHSDRLAAAERVNRYYVLFGELGNPLFTLVQVLVTKENGIAEVTSGHVINLVSKDMEPFTNAAFYFIYVPMAPLELAAISSLLSYFVGFGSLASMFVVLASLVMQVRYTSALR